MKAFASSPLALALVARAAVAAPDDDALVFAIDACVEVDPAEVRRLARIELAAGAHLPPMDGGVPVARVRCAGDARVVRIDDPVTGKALERALSFADVAPAARSRLLALATVQLLAASWAELQVSPRPTPAGQPTPSAEVRQAVQTWLAPRPQTAWRLLAVAAAQHSGGDFGQWWAGGLRLGADRLSGATFAFELTSVAARAPVSLGAVELRGAALAIDGGWRVGAAGGRVVGRATIGVGLGLARASGRASDPELADPHAFAALWGGPRAAASVEVRLLGSVVAELAICGGDALVPLYARVDARREAVLRGPWVGASLGFGVRL